MQARWGGWLVVALALVAAGCVRAGFDSVPATGAADGPRADADGGTDGPPTDGPPANDRQLHDAPATEAGPPAPVVVSEDGWGWRNPLPHGNGLNAVWGTSATDVWIVGAQGLALHHDGAGWTAVKSGLGHSARLEALWGSSPTSIWAVAADGRIIHFDGTGWTTQVTSTEPLSSIWGTSASDIWAAGPATKLSHFNGTIWITAAVSVPVDLYGIWGASPSQVWAVGHATSGTILRYDGQGCRPP